MTRPRERKYDVMIGEGKNVESKIMTSEELRLLAWNRFKVIICIVTARMVVTSSSGERIVYEDRWPRMGRVSLRLLEALLLNSGEYLTPVDLAEITGNDNLRENGTVAARILAIRKTLWDRNETYIQTQKTPGHYAARWTGKPFIWVKRAPNELSAPHTTDGT